MAGGHNRARTGHTDFGQLSIDEELEAFCRRRGFGDVPGARPRTVTVCTGCMLVPLPNIETRRKFLKYHDIHHLVTGYSVGRIGEGEMRAWELGSASALASPLLGVMNLIALSTGLIVAPRRMWRAFERGCRSRNLCGREARADVGHDRWRDVAALGDDILETRVPSAALPVRATLFFVNAALALLIHACSRYPR